MKTRTLALAVLAASIGGCKGKRATPARTATEVVVRAAAGDLPRTDPTSKAWDKASEMIVTLLPQDLVEPKLVTPGVARIKVRALHDAGWIAFRLEWADATRDVLLGPGRFSDGVAVQLPTEAGSDVTDPAMGLKGRPVAISYWKAAWQETADPVAALRPNMPPTFYPPAAASGGQRATLEREFAPARGANNPSTNRAPGDAVQDLLAEGAGTLTVATGQDSIGRGTWQGGVWRVTIARPLGPPDTSPFRPGRRTYVAFAVWDGAAGNAGAKKMRTVWIPLTLEEAK
jgi:hypothetical protein